MIEDTPCILANRFHLFFLRSSAVTGQSSSSTLSCSTSSCFLDITSPSMNDVIACIPLVLHSNAPISIVYRRCTKYN